MSYIQHELMWSGARNKLNARLPRQCMGLSMRYVYLYELWISTDHRWQSDSALRWHFAFEDGSVPWKPGGTYWLSERPWTFEASNRALKAAGGACETCRRRKKKLWHELVNWMQCLSLMTRRLMDDWNSALIETINWYCQHQLRCQLQLRLRFCIAHQMP